MMGLAKLRVSLRLISRCLSGRSCMSMGTFNTQHAQCCHQLRPISGSLKVRVGSCVACDNALAEAVAMMGLANREPLCA